MPKMLINAQNEQICYSHGLRVSGDYGGPAKRDQVNYNVGPNACEIEGWRFKRNVRKVSRGITTTP